MKLRKLSFKAEPPAQNSFKINKQSENSNVTPVNSLRRNSALKFAQQFNPQNRQSFNSRSPHNSPCHNNPIKKRDSIAMKSLCQHKEDFQKHLEASCLFDYENNIKAAKSHFKIYKM